jgi:hypothetical protein
LTHIAARALKDSGVVPTTAMADEPITSQKTATKSHDWITAIGPAGATASKEATMSDVTERQLEDMEALVVQTAASMTSDRGTIHIPVVAGVSPGKCCRTA